MNFDEIEEYPIDLDTVNIDTNMIDSIYIGPQGDLLETIEDFNMMYNTDIGITRQFTLKPGGYDKIKKAYANHVLRFDMKPKGIGSLFKRIADHAYRFNALKRDILSVESKMQELRQTGLRWQDNADDFNDEFNKLKSNVNKSLDSVHKLYPNIKAQCKLLIVDKRSVVRQPRYYGHNYAFPTIYLNDDGILPADKEYILAINMTISNLDMLIHQLKDGELIQFNLPMHELHVCTGVYLLPMLSRNWGREDNTNISVQNKDRLFVQCAYLSPMCLNQHPYIQAGSDSYRYELDGYTHTASNICLGNMQPEIKATLLNGQIDAHITHVMNWLGNYYIPQTNPLNRINKLVLFGRNETLAQQSIPVIRDELVKDPKECGLAITLSHNINNHALKKTRWTYYGDQEAQVTYYSDEYKDRLEEYLQIIDRKDLPCHNCELSEECLTFVHIEMILKSQLTHLEEAYLGMYVELYNVVENGAYVNRRVRRPLVFVEEILGMADRWNVELEYDKFVLACRVADKSCSEDEERSYMLSSRWGSIVNTLWNKMGDNQLVIEALKVLALNDTLILQNTEVNAICDVLYSNSFKKTKKNEVTTIDTDSFNEVVRDAAGELEQIPAQEAHEATSIPLESEALTPEELTIRWAMTQGGANNL